MKISIVATVLLLSTSVVCLDCYFCQSTAKDDCYHGYKSVPTRPCSEAGACISVKVEVAEKGEEHVRTLRGCQARFDPSQCSTLMGAARSAAGVESRGLSCCLCRGHLCNAAPAAAPGLLFPPLLLALRKALA